MGRDPTDDEPAPPQQPVDPAAVAAALPDGAFVLDRAGIVTWANPAVADVVGWSPADVLGRNVVDFTHPDDLPLVLASLATMRERTVGEPIEVRTRQPSGDWAPVEVMARNCLDDPAIAGIVCTSRDLSRRRAWEVAAGDDIRLNRAVQYAPAIVLLLDGDGVITSVNGAFTRMLGWDNSEIVGRRLVGFVSDEHERDALARAVATSLVDATQRVEALLATHDGRPPVPVGFAIANLLDDPLVRALVVTGHDITELQAARQQLEHLASHDPLTDLANRTMLLRSIEGILQASRPVALLYVDLDRFKPVNDRYGHGVGDEVLRRVARRLVDATAPSDVVARIGGDEFVVLAVGITEREAAVALAGELRRRIEAPFVLPEGVVTISASIGAVLAGAGATAESLLLEADRDMYHGKGPGPPPDR